MCHKLLFMVTLTVLVLAAAVPLDGDEIVPEAPEDFSMVEVSCRPTPLTPCHLDDTPLNSPVTEAPNDGDDGDENVTEAYDLFNMVEVDVAPKYADIKQIVDPPTQVDCAQPTQCPKSMPFRYPNNNRCFESKWGKNACNVDPVNDKLAIQRGDNKCNCAPTSYSTWLNAKPKDTGGTCAYFACKAFRDAECVDDKCICPADKNAHNDRCVKPEPAPTGTSTVSPVTCNPVSGFTCSVHGQCSSTAATYTCTCDPGYYGYSCDSGPYASTFKSLSRPVQQEMLIAVEASSLAYGNEAFSWVNLIPRALATTVLHLDGPKLLPNGINRDILGVRAHFGLHKDQQLPFLAFRGTSTASEIVQDMKFHSTEKVFKGQQMRVVLGFNDAIFYNWDEIKKQVQTLLSKSNKKEILVTGHSLGGAMATLCSAYLSDWMPDLKIKLITVEAPRTGDASFARYVEEKTAYWYRVTNSQVTSKDSKSDITTDYVTRVPNYNTHFGLNRVWYMHGGTQVDFGVNDGTEQADGFAITGKSWTPLSLALHSSGRAVRRILYLAGQVDEAEAAKGGKDTVRSASFCYPTCK